MLPKFLSCARLLFISLVFLGSLFRSPLLLAAAEEPIAGSEEPLSSPQVVISTNLGDMTFALDSKVAPNTTAQFIKLANSGWYNGKAFYRVVKGHVIQAGINDDLHPDHKKYQLDGEFSPEKQQIKGSLGMARDDDPNSGSTEFYICLARRAHLDGKYTHFGQLIAGEAVLDKIAAVPVTEKWLDNPAGKAVAFHQPQTAVVIRSIQVKQH
jgi:cyclophilin family peptidyl-prolyl cis-trans isomerase